MLRQTIYPKVESLLNRMAQFLNRNKVSPNQLTLIGLALNLFAGLIYASGNLFAAGFIMLLAGLPDLLDGPLARVSDRVTKFGAFLDSTVDRYSDFFLFGGLSLHFFQEAQEDLLLLALGTLAGSFVTSYAKARAENFIEKCSVGIFERAERIITLALGSLFPGLMGPILWILFLGTNGTALQRIFHTRRVLSENSPPS